MFVPGQPGMQLTELADWIDALNIHYYLGIDGLSLPLILLTTLLTLLSVIYSWRITDRIKEYMIFFLLLETGMLGVFCALDFFLFYIFWEVSLVPMFFIMCRPEGCAGLLGLLSGLCHQGADVPLPYLVAGRSRGGANGG